jgi:hypothetical protein
MLAKLASSTKRFMSWTLGLFSEQPLEGGLKALANRLPLVRKWDLAGRRYGTGVDGA